MTRRYTTPIIIVVEREMRVQLVAIAYHMGQKGLYSRPAKNFIKKGIEEYLASLTPKARAAYDEIMMNVQMLADQGEIKGLLSLAAYQERMARMKKRPRN